MSVSVTVFFHWWYRNVLVCMDSIIPEVIQGLTRRFLRLERVLGSTLKLSSIVSLTIVVNFSNSPESMLKVTGLYSFSSSVLINLSIFD